MTWPQKTIQYWSEFTQFVDALVPRSVLLDRFLCRGQADEAWSLEDSITRIMAGGANTANAIAIEKAALREFMSQAHLYINSSDLPQLNDLLAWWALMQHYGAPTRLLDWSESPYVALYFTVRGSLETWVIWTEFLI